MNTQSNHSIKSLDRRQVQDKHFSIQLETIYNAFTVKPMTMKEVDVYTGIMRENVCRHVDTLHNQGRIAVIRKRKCSITGWIANEYTTNPSLFPIDNQLNLFCDKPKITEL